MAKINGSAFTTEEHEDFTQTRDASITKDHVVLFTYTGGSARNPDTAKEDALKELTALYPYNFLDDTEYIVFQAAT
jgi:hypothetical protein